MANASGIIDHREYLEQMGRAVMAFRGGNPDAVNWKAMFANVNADKIIHDKVKVFDCVRSRVYAALREQGVIRHG